MKPFFDLGLRLLLLLTGAGCGSGLGDASDGDGLELVWGRRGLQPGDLIRPRALAIDTRDGRDLLYVADFTGRIQVFERDGRYLRGWSTPTIVNGRPAGIAIGRDGDVLVADSHYGQVLVYSPEGELRRKITSTNRRPLAPREEVPLAPREVYDGPGPFAYVSDVGQDAQGNFYIAEFGDNDRIWKFSPDGRYLKHWGNHGSKPGEFSRPRALALGPSVAFRSVKERPFAERNATEVLYVADAGNHRIQVFDLEGRLLRHWGRHGANPGELSYPYDVAIGKNGDVYVLEYGNHRVQRFSATGESRGCWGQAGRSPGSLHNPWGLAVDSRGRVHVVDTDNHRVQRIAF